MSLSTRDFSDVLAQLRENSAQVAAGAERRRSTRMTVQARLDIFPLDGPFAGRSFQALTSDISFLSIGLVQSPQVTARQKFVAALPRAGRAPLYALYTVMRCSPLADGIYSVGCDLDTVTPSEILAVINLTGNPALNGLRDTIQKQLTKPPQLATAR